MAEFKGVRGIPGMQKGIYDQLAIIKGKSLKALISIQSKIHRDMESIPPRVPVDLRNLSNSYFCVTSNGAVITGKSPRFKDDRKDADRMLTDHSDVVLSSLGDTVSKGKVNGPTVTFGFSAYYATIVHESRNTNFKRPGAGPKFFEAHIKANKDFILKTLAKYAKVKK